ncbi:MAG: nitrate ABC transporter permease [Pseudomonadota bacterium]
MTAIINFKHRNEAGASPQRTPESRPPAAAASSTAVPPPAASAAGAGAERRPSGWPQRLSAALTRTIAPLLGFLGLLAVWAAAAQHATHLPGPLQTWQAALPLFADPFYVNGPNDVGVGWLVLNSLERVALGFGLAIAAGVPLGFAIGRFAFFDRASGALISLLRPVSPLAWLPIGLAVFQAAHPSAIFVIFITSIWPIVINTALGVKSVPGDYLNVARVLRLSEWKVFTRILLPASLPHVLSGLRLGLGTAWLVIVAAEMLTGGVGIGFWIWDEWNNLNMEHIIIAIFIVGFVGLALERGMTLIADRFDYRNV